MTRTTRAALLTVLLGGATAAGGQWSPAAPRDAGRAGRTGPARGSARPERRGTVVTERLTSAVLRENRIGLDPTRRVQVYLPPGYATSGRAYPVVYYFHSTFSGPEQVSADGALVRLLERGVAQGVVDEVIVVAADYGTATTGSVYENSAVSGRWLDFTTRELVPFVDGRFRTLRHRDSRAVVGEFFGGRAALKLAMTRADLFGVAYALHPVAVGMGTVPWAALEVDWRKIHRARSFADLAGDNRSQLFVTISQGFLPNPARPPFYCDFFVELERGEPTLHAGNVRRAKAEFHLEEGLEGAAAGLRTMRGLALDWARFDPLPGHVYASSAFSRKLEDLGVPHEAEEYRGTPGSQTWTADGRFYARVLPFLARRLAFGAAAAEN